MEFGNSKKYTITYVGDDKDAEKTISSLSEKINSFFFHKVPPKNQTPADVIILDSRKALRRRPDRISQGHEKTQYLTLILDGIENRKNIFNLGYSDYLLWPIVVQEFQRRLASCVHFFPSGDSLTTKKLSLSERACEYMTNNIAKEINLDVMIRVLATNKNTLCKAFREDTGMTPISWLRKQRMDRAADALLRGDDLIFDIARSVGYPDPNNFSTAFRKECGCSPVEYRKINNSKG